MSCFFFFLIACMRGKYDFAMVMVSKSECHSVEGSPMWKWT